MKILLSSHFFHPSVGGTEEVSRVLAHEFSALGHDVKVVTANRGGEGRDALPFEVMRRPDRRRGLLRLTAWCDVFFHNNISLRTAWPLLSHAAPVGGGASHLDRAPGRPDRPARPLEALRDPPGAKYCHQLRGERAALRSGHDHRQSLSRCAFPRRPDRGAGPGAGFSRPAGQRQGARSAFRGARELARARPAPAAHGHRQGARRSKICGQLCAAKLGLEAQVEFAGTKTGQELVALLNRHRIMVVPSRWQEPFGVVALEGIACGCVAIVARCGGLPDAVGRCGVTFEHEDVADLARDDRRIARSRQPIFAFRSAAPGASGAAFGARCGASLFAGAGGGSASMIVLSHPTVNAFNRALAEALHRAGPAGRVSHHSGLGPAQRGAAARETAAAPVAGMRRAGRARAGLERSRGTSAASRAWMPFIGRWMRP